MAPLDTETRERLLREAEELLRENDRGGYTIPSPELYPHQWAWDSGFAAVGWLHVDPERAVAEIETLFENQWRDGRVPHITFRASAKEYFPGPDFWETERTSSLTNPPTWTLALRRIVDAGYGDLVDSELIEAVDASHRFFHRHRDPEGWGAICVVHPWENGLDNSPAWDRPMARVDVSGVPEFDRVDIDKVDDPSERPTDEDYRRYTALVKAIAADDFGRGDFAVYDPWMTAFLIRAEEDLAWLGERLEVDTGARERADRLCEGLVERLWSDEHGRYLYYDVLTSTFYAPDLLPAYAGLITGRDLKGSERMEATLAESYTTAYPLPTVPPSSDDFEPQRYWRGPTWVNTNWLYAAAVGEELVDSTLRMIADAGFREYYHPVDGRGLGARDFTWSAALALDLLSDRA